MQTINRFSVSLECDWPQTEVEFNAIASHPRLYSPRPVKIIVDKPFEFGYSQFPLIQYNDTMIAVPSDLKDGVGFSQMFYANVEPKAIVFEDVVHDEPENRLDFGFEVNVQFEKKGDSLVYAGHEPNERICAPLISYIDTRGPIHILNTYMLVDFYDELVNAVMKNTRTIIEKVG